MKIGIFTTFYNMSPQFSLVTVVKQQLIALAKYGYQPVLFVLENFDDDSDVPEGVEVRKVLPQIILEPYGSRDLSNLEEDAERVRVALEEHMADIDVCLTHDIIFINTYLPYNIGMRRALEGKLGALKWLHWMHSGPSFANLDGSVWDNLRTLPPNSFLIYMNYTDAIRAAEMYNTMPRNVRTIFNPMDIRDLYNFHPLTRKLIDYYDLMSPDVLAVYPLSSTRMDTAGKQLSKAIRIMAEIKKRGKTIRFVIPNAHANADREKRTIRRMYEIAREFGMEDRELIFTSLFDVPNNELGVPHKVVQDLFQLSNVFLFPSYSENCPLILLEAMAGKNVLVLNQDFPAMKDFGQENAMYFRFSSTVAPNPDFPGGEENYYRDVAILVLSELDQNKAIKAQTKIRKEFNVDYIFKQQLEPAIKEIFHG